VFINVLAQLRRKLPAEEALIFDSFSKTINHWIFDSSAEIEDSELSEQFEKSKMLFSEDSPVSPIFEDAINAIQAMYWQQKHQRLTEILHLLDEAK